MIRNRGSRLLGVREILKAVYCGGRVSKDVGLRYDVRGCGLHSGARNSKITA